MTEETIRAYFLQELSAEESERFEAESFAREELATEISAGEDDLIEAYLCDELTAEQRGQFERNYLTTTARQERVAQHAAFLRHVAEQCTVNNQPATPATIPVASPDVSWQARWRALWAGQKFLLRGGSALAGLAVLITAVWFLSRPAQPKTFAFLTLTMQESRTRDAGDQADRSQSLKIPPGTDALQITLLLPANAPPAQQYRALLLDAGTKSDTLTATKHDAKTVTFEIPSRQLPHGRYILNLTAIQSDGTQQPLRGSYYFTVE